MIAYLGLKISWEGIAFRFKKLWNKEEDFLMSVTLGKHFVLAKLQLVQILRDNL